MNPSPFPIRRLMVTFLVVVILGGVAWRFLVSHSFVQIKLGANAERAEIVSAQTNKTIATATAGGWLNLPTGDYLVNFYSGDSITSVQSRHVGSLSFGSVSAVSGEDQKTSTFLKRPADLVTPLGAGFIYINKTTRGVSYAQGTTVIDLSDRLGLTNDPKPSLQLSSNPLYNTVVGIQAVAGGKVCVTTTQNIYLLSGPNATQITTLPAAHGQATLNYTASAYDAQTNQLYAMAPRSTTLYRFDLGKPTQAPSELKTDARIMNRIAAGNGKLIVSYDDVPNTNPEVLDQYDIRYQVTPLILNADTGKTLRKLTNYRASTYISISDSGRYAAIKPKFINTMDIYDLDNNSTHVVPAYDTAGFAWKQNTAYIARAGTAWSYNAADPNDGLVKVGKVSEPVTRLTASSLGIIVTTNADTTSLLAAAGAPVPAITPAEPATPSVNPLIYYLPPPETN